jgi:hypothetical protein
MKPEVGDLVNVVYDSTMFAFGIYESAIQNVMMNNPHEVTRVENRGLGKEGVEWIVELRKGHNYYWPDYMIEPIHKEPDWVL